MKRKIDETTNRREYHILFLKEEYPPYWDEGVHFYPRWRRGYKNTHKEIMSYQVRMYKTWKHNRKTQWKN
jgi:hypothetical protein